jgi:hypothetical protein
MPNSRNLKEIIFGANCTAVMTLRSIPRCPSFTREMVKVQWRVSRQKEPAGFI